MAEIVPASICAPFPAETEERVRVTSLIHKWVFTLEDGNLIYTLEPQSNCSITFDENWAPYAQLQGSFRWVDDNARQRLDPRLPSMIRVKAGYVWGYNTENVYDLAVLHLRSATISAPSMDVEITAASSECELQDYLWYLASDAPVPTGDTKTALAWCLDNAHNREPFVAETNGGAVKLPPDGVKRGQNIWDLARDIAAGGNTWFYHDGLGQWHLRPRPIPVSTAKTVLQTGPSGTIISYQIGQDREQYADGLIVRHKWSEGSGSGSTSKEVTGKSSIANPTRWRLIDRDTAIDQDGVNAEAKTLLARYMDRRRTVEVTAKAAYWVRPGDTVSLKVPGLEALARVSRVQFTYPAGRMQVRLVLPESEPIS